jgi:glucokinase
MINTFFVWDLGATKCSAGLIEYNTDSHDLICKKKITIKLSNTVSLLDLVEQLENGLGLRMIDVDAICIGAAGQYDGEILHLEGAYSYPMQFAKIAKLKNWPVYAVIHDYAPIVCATFTSYMEQSQNVMRLNSCPLDTYGRRVALGIGTGLGLKDGVLLPNGNFWLGRNEIGHIGIPTPPLTDSASLQRHEELLRYLQSSNDAQPITFEKILSGPGTVRLHQFFYPSTEVLTPEEVGIKLREKNAPEMLDTFAWYVGLLIGTVQLSFMPEGGIWITGGVALNHLALFECAEFFAGIKALPAYLPQRETFPLGVLCNLEHALIGSAYYAVKKLLYTKPHPLRKNKLRIIKNKQNIAESFS